MSMFYNGVELYVRSGKIGVLVSPGYGAGWSTWGDQRIAYDKRVIEFWLEHKDDKEYMDAVDAYADCPQKEDAKKFFGGLGYEEPYMGGFNQIVLKWVKPGEPWKISEYDGWESLETLSNGGFITF